MSDMDPGTVLSGGGTLASRLAEARARTFVGRKSELDLIRSALRQDPSPFSVLFLHGPGGIGKTALLRQFATAVEATGCIAALVDARTATGGPVTFISALATALGLPPDADAVAALHAGPRTVLLIDGYEASGGLDEWLRDRFLPELPAQTLVVCAGRGPPAAAWRTEPGWQDLAQVVALRNLPPREARALLSARGVPASSHGDVLALTGGYPLALSLMADVVAQRGPVGTLADVPDVVAALLERFVAGAPSEAHRTALQIAAHARVASEALLRDVLPDVDAAALFAWLRRLSFMEPRSEGLALHDIAREVLDADLRWRDKDGFRGLHTRVRRHIVRRVQESSGAEQVRAFRDFMDLHRHNPLFAPFHSWRDEVRARSLHPGDIDELVALAAERDGPETARLVRFWAVRAPENFVVCDPLDGGPVAGFFALLRLASPSREERSSDAVVRALADHVERRGLLRPGEHLLLGRFIVSRVDHGLPSPTMDLCQIMSTMRSITPPYPALTMVLPPGLDPTYWDAVLTYIDWPRLPGIEVSIEGRTVPVFGHDWRIRPPEAWLALMGDREIDLDLDLTALRRERPATTTVLSKPEFDEAVRAALKHCTRPDALTGNPLLTSRLIAAQGEDAITRLVDLVVDATDALRGSPQGDKLHRAVATTFFKGVPTQEAAAERLGLAFSTYRRHLTAGIARVIAWLWEREVQGSPTAGS